MRRTLILSALVAAVALIGLVPVGAAEAGKKSDDLVLVVLDPMALELSCPCVKGYAPRNYKKFGEFLGKQLGRKVNVHFAETLTAALTRKTSGRADLVIGKDSVIRAGATSNKLDLTPLAALTDKEGKTTQTGLWVVAAKEPATTAADLKGYDLYFGPADADEKYTAALALLKDLDVKVPEKLLCCNSCTDTANKILDAHKAGKKAAGVISGYAQPLLEGCGTIKKGDLRVIGETDPVPFVVAFANAKLSRDDRDAIEKALLAVAKDESMCKLMETKKGFVVLPTTKKK